MPKIGRFFICRVAIRHTYCFALVITTNYLDGFRVSRVRICIASPFGRRRSPIIKLNRRETFLICGRRQRRDRFRMNTGHRQTNNNDRPHPKPFIHLSDSQTGNTTSSIPARKPKSNSPSTRSPFHKNNCGSHNHRRGNTPANCYAIHERL